MAATNGRTLGHTVDGRIPAPSKQPWNHDSPLNTNKGSDFNHGFKVLREADFATIHSISFGLSGGPASALAGLRVLGRFASESGSADLGLRASQGYGGASFGCGSKLRTQNGTLTNGNLDYNLRSISWWFNFDPHSFQVPSCPRTRNPPEVHVKGKWFSRTPERFHVTGQGNPWPPNH